MTLAGLTGLAPLALAGDKPVIEAIEGDNIVVVKTVDGANHVAGRGTEINFGDRVKTGPHASAKILYPDGSKLLVGRATEMSVVDSGKDGVQVNELAAGEVRGIIRKPKSLVPGAPPRFVVRTRSAVMGVRGTDFVFNLLDDAAKKSEIHTLDGTVEVAKTQEDLMAGRGVSVHKDEVVHGDDGKIDKPQKFEREEYVKSMEAQQPEFVALVRNDPEAISRDSLVPEAEKPVPPRLKLLSFQMSEKYIKQTESGGNLFTAQVSWNPQLRLLGPFALRGILGVSPLKSRSASAQSSGQANTGDKFAAYELGAVLSFSLFSPLLLEAGLGGQIWSGGRARNDPEGMVNVAWKLSEDRLLERLFVGLTAYQQRHETTGGSQSGSSTSVNQTKTGTLEVRAGIGIQF